MIGELDFGTDAVAIALRLLAAALAGAVLGVNRDLHSKPAGLRTLSLVSTGSAVLVLAILIMTRGSADAASRVIQGIVTGVGFLGAGVIIHHEPEHRVEGLTTAASVWVAAGMGAACGAGLAVLALFSLIATMAILIFGGRVEKALRKRFLATAGASGMAGSTNLSGDETLESPETGLNAKKSTWPKGN